MTLDRDIRLTPDQMLVTARALRDEVRKHTRSIEKADAARRAGAKVQHGVLESHHKERAAALEVLEALEVARKQIGHQIAAKLGVSPS